MIRTILKEILGGVAMFLVMAATVVLLLMCSAHETRAETWESLGTHRITHYCNCEKCCGKWAGGKTASGTVPTRYQTVAVSTKEIPLGSTIYIEGYGFRIAEDTGVSSGTIDVFCPDHQLCLQLGVKRREVWIVRD